MKQVASERNIITYQKANLRYDFAEWLENESLLLMGLLIVLINLLIVKYLDNMTRKYLCNRYQVSEIVSSCVNVNRSET